MTRHINPNDEIVSASEIARWAWCPESWRLDAVGHEPENRAALNRGEKLHARNAAFEARSRSAIAVGWRLLATAVVLVAVALLARGQ